MIANDFEHFPSKFYLKKESWFLNEIYDSIFILQIEDFIVSISKKKNEII